MSVKGRSRDFKVPRADAHFTIRRLARFTLTGRIWYLVSAACGCIGLPPIQDLTIWKKSTKFPDNIGQRTGIFLQRED
jgi:hypothetical protein